MTPDKQIGFVSHSVRIGACGRCLSSVAEND